VRKLRSKAKGTPVHFNICHTIRAATVKKTPPTIRVTSTSDMFVNQAQIRKAQRSIAGLPPGSHAARVFFWRLCASGRICSSAAVGTRDRPPSNGLPKWIKPHLTRLVDEAPLGNGWLHEIKYDGYRMHARIADGQVKLLTRTGFDWSHRYRRTIEALRTMRVKAAYIDGELCALNGDGVPVFSRLQAAMDEGRTNQLVFFAFDLLFLNGESPAGRPLLERKERLQRLFKTEITGLRYSEHVIGDGPRFLLGLELISCYGASTTSNGGLPPASFLPPPVPPPEAYQ
jgi:ATP-dependent DNA ligase